MTSKPERMPTKKISERRDSNGEKVAAKVVIYRGAEMTAKGRRQIAGWLRRQADFLEKKADRMANQFTATWRYSDADGQKGLRWKYKKVS